MVSNPLPLHAGSWDWRSLAQLPSALWVQSCTHPLLPRPGGYQAISGSTALDTDFYCIGQNNGPQQIGNCRNHLRSAPLNSLLVITFKKSLLLSFFLTLEALERWESVTKRPGHIWINEHAKSLTCLPRTHKHHQNVGTTHFKSRSNWRMTEYCPTGLLYHWNHSSFPLCLARNLVGKVFRQHTNVKKRGEFQYQFKQRLICRSKNLLWFSWRRLISITNRILFWSHRTKIQFHLHKLRYKTVNCNRSPKASGHIHTLYCWILCITAALLLLTINSFLPI